MTYDQKWSTIPFDFANTCISFYLYSWVCYRPVILGDKVVWFLSGRLVMVIKSNNNVLWCHKMVSMVLFLKLYQVQQRCLIWCHGVVTMVTGLRQVLWWKQKKNDLYLYVLDSLLVGNRPKYGARCKQEVGVKRLGWRWGDRLRKRLHCGYWCFVIIHHILNYQDMFWFVSRDIMLKSSKRRLFFACKIYL